jgi:hypothetical protein
MLSIQHKYVANQAGHCSDCGNMAVKLSRGVDQHTSSTVSLCPNCVPAFIQRQQMPPGCCGE